MDVICAIESRRSIRRYKQESIPNEKLNKLLEAARLAPSAGNRQPWELIVVTNKETLKKLPRACKDQKFVSECSVFIAGIGDPQQKWYQVDLAIAFEHIALAAVELGLGSCWIGAFYEEEIKQILSVPENKAVVACMTIGIPAESPEARPRKSIKELVHWERY
ncbi:MAG: nitroreductase family protein [Candidatus Thermoplasmatota archaeon]